LFVENQLNQFECILRNFLWFLWYVSTVVCGWQLILSDYLIDLLADCVCFESKFIYNIGIYFNL